MIIDEDAYLMHYGILRKSGRYPWGSGKTQHERNKTFLDTVNELKKSGSSDVEIAKMFDLSTTQLRAARSIAVNEQRQERIRQAQRLHDKGVSNSAIGRQMGINESSVRSLLAPGAADRSQIIRSTADMLKRQLEEKGMIDVGSHVSSQIGVSDTRLKTAVAMLREEGYNVTYPKVPQLGTAGQETTLRVLSRPDIPKPDVYKAAREGNIRQLQEYSDSGGREGWLSIQPPIHIDSKRLEIKYKEDGGADADGVIYVRPGAKDLDMGHNRYAQVRIAVDGTHYLKGMAVLKDDLPDGVDLQFNTNKSNTGHKLDALKPLKVDKSTGEVDQGNPFGAVVRQLPRLDEHGRAIPGTVRSALNLVNKEEDWERWSRSLSSQFLSKQSPELAREQLEMAHERRKNDLTDILRLTNPAVKQKLLESFADDADSASWKLKAQALPRQRVQVLLPIKNIKETEVYAPTFNNGERIVLVRHPHGGTFELPELVVNNRNPEGKKLIGAGATAAIGIHPKVAARLSGADFDGDTVLAIPNNSGRIKTSSPLEGLKGFDPQTEYKPYHGMRTIDGGTWNEATKSVDYHGKTPNPANMQRKMGEVSNLITDMTIKGANPTELARAVRHSMVVIDAEKHHLDYVASARDNGIPALSAKYQKGTRGGASTLISQAKREIKVPARKPRSAKDGGPIDRQTGELRWTPTNERFVSKRNGQEIVKTQTVKQLLETKTAHELVSAQGTRIEAIYADHSDRLRALANQARRELVNTKPMRMSESAKRAYAPQVKTLNAKLAEAEANRPRERQAQIIGNHLFNQMKAAYPDADKADLRKLEAKALLEGRARAGAVKKRVEITDEEWAAIQAGAISHSKLERILANTDVAAIRERATPRTQRVVSSAMQARARSMLESGYTQADVAAQLGISVNTLMNALK